MNFREFLQGLLQPKKVNKFTLYVGLNDKNTRVQEFSIEEAKNIISKEFAENEIEGATFLGAEGIYTYKSDNTTEKENSFKIEILFASKKQVENAVAGIKTKLNQESVAVVEEKIVSSLI